MNKFQITRQERETNQSLIRRFTKRMKESGILTNAKKAAFKRRGKNKNVQKESALRKIQKRAEYEKLEKLGKL